MVALRLDEDGMCLDCPEPGHPGNAHTAESCLMPGCDCNPSKPPPPPPVSLAGHPAFALGALEALGRVEDWVMGERIGRLGVQDLMGKLWALRREYGDVRAKEPGT